MTSTCYDYLHLRLSHGSFVEVASLFNIVQVDRNAKPPVCKIMDFHKEMYKQQLKEKDRLKGKVCCSFCLLLLSSDFIRACLIFSVLYYCREHYPKSK